MPVRPVPLVKLTRPSPARIVRRARLLRLLNRGRAGGVWVTGPPGSGKSTLVASYVAARRLPGVWYQIDPGDGDPATFFYYLGQAIQRAARRRRPPLPLLTPEYTAGLSTFTRRYVELLAERLPPPFTLVFDNLHELPAEALTHRILRDVLTTLPRGGRIILISRTTAPAIYAKVRAEGTLSGIEWADLKLTERETRAIARLRHGRPLSPRVVQALQQTAGGWLAGILLALARLKDHPASPFDETAVEELFAYFAGEVFDRTDPATREVLLRTAFVPYVTAAMAERLTGRRDAGRILDALAQRHDFTEHQLGIYRYHDLFRAFLQAKARAAYGPVVLTQLYHRSATALEAEGQIEEAVALFAAAGDWAAMTRIILTAAPTLVTQGRTQTVDGWIASLPEAVTKDVPWLTFWQGICRFAADPLESRALFERAFERFCAQGDQVGMLLSWSWAVDTFYYWWDDCHPLDRWIAWMDERLRAAPAFPSIEIEARVTASMIVALMFRQPHHPDLATWIARARVLVGEVTDADIRTRLYFGLAHYYAWTGDLPRVVEINEGIQRIGSREVPATIRIMCTLWQAVYEWFTLRHEQCVATLTEAIELGRAAGVQQLDGLLHSQAVYSYFGVGDLTGGAESLRCMQETMNPAKRFEVGHYHYLRSWEAMLHGHHAQALEHAQRSLALTIEVGAPFSQGLSHAALAQVFTELGEYRRAAKHVAAARALGHGMHSRLLDFLALLADADLALARGRTVSAADSRKRLNALRDAFAIGRQEGFVNVPWWRPSMMSRLCAAALEAGIEVDYVRQLIRVRHLPVPEGMVMTEQWPREFEIRTLGGFDVVLHAQPIPREAWRGRKTQHLLAALVTLGASEVPKDALIDRLWPDRDGDRAVTNFHTTLHRLQTVLAPYLDGRPGCLQLRDGRLSFDPTRCWVDSLAFEDAVRQARRSETAGHAQDTRRHLERAKTLYRGDFLSGWSEPWVEHQRTALREQFQWVEQRLSP